MTDAITRQAAAQIVKDVLSGPEAPEPDPDYDETGGVIWLPGQGDTTYDAIAYDDDRIPYFEMKVTLSDDDTYDGGQDAQLEHLLNFLGNSHGVTYIRFPDHPELDVG